MILFGKITQAEILKCCDLVQSQEDQLKIRKF